MSTSSTTSNAVTLAMLTSSWAVTMTDLYPNEEWNFVFGMARIKNRLETFSFSRYRKDPTVALKFDPAVRHQ
ncbi:MAG: hypothetical protein P8P32_01575 [Akkermansiaceae bacterium]|nr:hypothetical protein [Akkermansiaceae bacterium]MDG2324260.1 hypothetical protein [Akkermansiaceae bacterium]